MKYSTPTPLIPRRIFSCSQTVEPWSPNVKRIFVRQLARRWLRQKSVGNRSERFCGEKFEGIRGVFEMLQRLSIALPLLLCACVGGDALVLVRGQIVAARPNDLPCSVQLRKLSSPAVASYNVRSVRDSFQVDFTVAPSSDTFVTEVICGGSVVSTTTIRATGPKTEIDIGKVSIKNELTGRE